MYTTEKPIWTEDDGTRGTPDHDSVYDAFERITGRDLDFTKSLAIIDRGDVLVYVFRDVMVSDYYGAWYTISKTDWPAVSRAID